MRENAPIGKVGLAATVTLATVALIVRFGFKDSAPGWLLSLAWFLAGVVLVLFLAELYLLFRDYRRGYLIPIRNATFFIVLLSLLALPVLVVYGLLSGEPLSAANLLLIPVFLYFCVRNLFYVYLDSVSLVAKTGPGRVLNVPRFGITGVKTEERKLIVRTQDGREIHLLRSFFFDTHWRQLREKLGVKA